MNSFKAAVFHARLSTWITLCCDVFRSTPLWRTRNAHFVISRLCYSYILIMAGQQPVKDEIASQISTDQKSVLILNGPSTVLHVILAAVLIALIVVVAMIIRWIYRKRKYNRLRHYLIPTYTFDPNEEETWDVDIDGQESAIFSGSNPQGYQSMDIKNNVGAPSTSSNYDH